jgi:hypothetical protein
MPVLRKGEVLDADLPMSWALEVTGRTLLLLCRDVEPGEGLGAVLVRVIRGYPNDHMGWVAVPKTLFDRQLWVDLRPLLPLRLVPRLEVLIACDKHNTEFEELLCLSN